MSFKSFDDYFSYAQNEMDFDELMLANQIKLTKASDLFRLPYGPILFSEQLKNKIKEEQLTGMVFNESSIEFSLGL